ncbi:MAG TPA: low affinity iron permease family protein [Acetobacteraceae bacterium]|jgi:low affinity Fe/Cu permease|nr:low affinity iron permease family protein [Acetobacteraceae bacterium]
MSVSVSEVFSRAAHWTAQQCGRAYVFIAAALTIVVWAATGPLFNYSDTWQLIINTGTTIVTFLMVFLIQNTQNRDTAAIQLKLDELIRANEKARNKMLRLEDLTEEELKTLKANFVELAGPAQGAIESVRQAKDELEDTEDALEQFSSRLSDAARG